MTSGDNRTLDVTSSELSPGTLVGNRYRIEELVGIGTFGQVYRATDEGNVSEFVAIKRFLAPSILDAEEAQEIRTLFWRETKLQLRLQHRNVIKILGIISEANSNELFIVSEFIEGGNLRRLLNTNRTIDLAYAVRILAPIADAISYSHQKRIIHRDIKPENILLRVDQNGAVCPFLTDFGLARHLAPSEMTSSHLGSPAYMAPEQFYGEYDFSTDIYSLGVILYELISGSRPFKGGFASLMRAHIYSAPPVIDDLPDDVASLLAKFLAKDPKDRFSTMEAAKEALLTLANHDEVTIHQHGHAIVSPTTWSEKLKKDYVAWDSVEWSWQIETDLATEISATRINSFAESWIVENGPRVSRYSIINGEPLSPLFKAEDNSAYVSISPNSRFLAKISSRNLAVLASDGTSQFFNLIDKDIEDPVISAALSLTGKALVVARENSVSLLYLDKHEVEVLPIKVGYGELIHQVEADATGRFHLVGSRLPRRIRSIRLIDDGTPEMIIAILDNPAIQLTTDCQGSAYALEWDKENHGLSIHSLTGEIKTAPILSSIYWPHPHPPQHLVLGRGWAAYIKEGVLEVVNLEKPGLPIIKITLKQAVTNLIAFRGSSLGVLHRDQSRTYLSCLHQPIGLWNII